MTEAATLAPATPSPVDRTLTCPGGGEAATGPIPSRSPVARLIPDPFGLVALGGNLRLFVFTLDDAARDALIQFLAGAPR